MSPARLALYAGRRAAAAAAAAEAGVGGMTADGDDGDEVEMDLISDFMDTGEETVGEGGVWTLEVDVPMMLSMVNPFLVEVGGDDRGVDGSLDADDVGGGVEDVGDGDELGDEDGMDVLRSLG